MRTTLALTATALLVLTGCAGTTDAEEENGTGSDDLVARTHEMHNTLDLAFEGCDWEIQDEEAATIISGCEAHNLFTVVGPGESSTLHVMEAMADANPWPAYYAIEDGAGVLAFDAGDRNLAQDMLGGGALTSGSFDS